MHNVHNYLEKLEGCIASNSREADQQLSRIIASQHPVIPGILHLKENSGGVLGWSKGNAAKASFLPAFHETLSQLPNMAFSGKFQILDENDIVFDGYDYYMLTKEPIQGLTLNKIAINGDESIATAIAEIRGYINMEFIICKLYLIGRVKKYLTSMWVGYGEEKESGEPVIFFAPIFPEDVAIFQEYDVNEIAREGMDEGETFIHGNKLWQVAQDDEGFYVYQPAPFMSVSLN